MRQTEKRRASNRATKKSIKLQIRALVEPAKDATPEKLKEELKLAIRKLDKAAARRVIHRNNAARKKSQLTRMLNAK
jgi:small subunit ribosomal protein S20